MSSKMPRGAIPVRRSDLAASEPFRPEAGAGIFVPGGEFPTPDHELAAAPPWRAVGSAPESFLAWPDETGAPADGSFQLTGAFNAVDWTDAAILNDAIANAGSVLIGIASANLTGGEQGRITPGKSGWAICNLAAGEPEDRWAGLYGYGSLSALVGLFERHGASVVSPPGMPAALCYAMSVWGSIGIIDARSLVNITGEAWVRSQAAGLGNLGG